MSLNKCCIIALLAITAMVLPAGTHVALAQESPPDFSSGLHTGWIMETSTVNSSWVFNRTFEYYIPTSYSNSIATPLLFSFHGLGSSGLGQIDLTKFDVLAEQQGFIAVFPDATRLDPADPRWSALNLTLPALAGSNIMWNCGAINGTPIAPLQYYAGVDDAGFVVDMVEWFEAKYSINESEIYSTGMSNGAMFSYFLAFYAPDVFAAIAPVCAPMPLNLGANADITPAPITVIVIRGTNDPVVPEPGECGLICDNFSFSTNETIAYWCAVDHTSTTPQVTTWGSTSRDPTSVTRYVYSGGTGGTQVILIMVTKGGHTWPGGVLYSGYVGAVTTHVDGSAQIWKYLPPEKYYLKTSQTLGGSVSTPGKNTFANVESDGATLFFPADVTPTMVDLAAAPDNTGFEFVNWTGDVSTIADADAATTSVTIQPNTDYEIRANFQLKSAEPEPEPTPSGGMCFIATAAYGTSTARQLDVLREFRDDVLLENAIGSRLVDLYYQISPPIAEFISEHSFVRTLVRELVIDPIVWVVETTGDMCRN